MDNLKDRGGRRSGMDRRKVDILEFLPDRRSGLDRRMTRDRRNRNEADLVPYLKRNADRYFEFANTQKGVLFGILLSLPIWIVILYWVIVRWTRF